MSTDFRVGPWLVKPSLNVVSLNGATAHLEPKVMELLVCLARHPGEAVAKEELVQAVWPETFVSDGALKRCISDLRRVFEDDAREPRIIQTIPKRGYRLVAPVESVNVTVESSAPIRPAPLRATRWSRRRWWAVLAVAVAILVSILLVAVNKIRSTNASGAPPIHSLAVLPLQNLSADSAQEYFSDGMTDALITELAQLGSVKVISRTSSMQYKQTKKSLPEIARELNVDGIVEGAVQRSNDRVRITVQLIHGPSDKHLWVNTYDRDIRDTLTLESNITGDIARHIQERITAGTAVQARQAKHVDAKVLEAFFQGNYHLQRFGTGGGGDEEQRKAAEYFQQAIDAEADYAPAYVGLAKAHLWLLWPSKQDADLVKRAAEHALQLDSNLSDAHTILGEINVASWNWKAGEEEFRRALAVDPNNADAHGNLGQLLLILGKLDEGYGEFEIAQTLDPGSDHLTEALEDQGQFDRAIDRQKEVLKLHPDDGNFHVELFRLYLKKGMYKEAYFHLNQSTMAFGLPENPTQANGRHDISDYRRAIRDSLRDYEHLITTHQAFIPMNVAEVYAALGDKDRAFYWLEWAYSQHDLGIASDDLHLERLNLEYLLDPLRSDPRFKDLLRRVGLPELSP